MLDYRSVLVPLHHGLQLVLSETIKNGDTKYHIECSFLHFSPSQW